jgi:hypothetical protein
MLGEGLVFIFSEDFKGTVVANSTRSLLWSMMRNYQGSNEKKRSFQGFDTG